MERASSRVGKCVARGRECRFRGCEPDCVSSRLWEVVEASLSNVKSWALWCCLRSIQYLSFNIESAKLESMAEESRESHRFATATKSQNVS